LFGALSLFFQGQSQGSFRVGKYEQSYPLKVSLRTGPLVRPLIQRVTGHVVGDSWISKVHNRGL